MKTAARALLVSAVLPLLATPAAGQRTEPGWIGISLDLPTLDGRIVRNADVVIGEVRRGSPAEEAGLRAGDRLLSVGDLRGSDDFRNLPERLQLHVGDRIRIRVERDGRRIEVQLRAAERPDDLKPTTILLAMESDSVVETMVRAMDSLRQQLTKARAGGQNQPVARSADNVRIVQSARPQGYSSPFEFFLFRSERDDSLRQAMEDLNRLTQVLERQEEARIAELSAAAARRDNVSQADDAQLRLVRTRLEEVSRESAELRTALSQAVGATTGADIVSGGLPPFTGSPWQVDEPTFSPLTPYVLGSNMVAGAQVVDLRPQLASYFDVEGGILIVDVAPGTPAAIAGMVPGDVITRLDQVSVRTVDQLRFGVSRSGDTLPVSLVRQGSTLEVLLSRR